MYNYSGIKMEMLELLALNRYNDSKPFYEEHKEELKQGVTIPMRQIVLDLSEMMCDIDPLTDTNPVYAVSRIRRDTRRTKSKMLYRENLWLMLRRNKFQYPFAPAMWFEFDRTGYTFGIGVWMGRPTMYDYIRKVILDNPERWLSAVETAENAGFSFGASDYYKRDKVPNAPENLRQYLNAKDLMFQKHSPNLKRLEDVGLIDELKEDVEALTPAYDIFIQGYDMAFSDGIINPDDYRR